MAFTVLAISSPPPLLLSVQSEQCGTLYVFGRSLVLPPRGRGVTLQMRRTSRK